MDNETQRELFARAVEALGGKRDAATAMGRTDRNVLRWIKGERRLHDDVLEDICKALIAHADLCRELERQLHPAFGGNRSPAQAKPPLHGGGRKRTPEQTATIEAAKAKLGLNPVNTREAD